MKMNYQYKKWAVITKDGEYFLDALAHDRQRAIDAFLQGTNKEWVEYKREGCKVKRVTVLVSIAS